MKTKALRETAVPFYFGHFAALSLVISLGCHLLRVIGHFAVLSLVISIVYTVYLR
jgi:hypothetical protein